MPPFETLFPGFLSKCADLHNLLLLVAYMLFIVGIVLKVSHGFSAQSMSLYLVRLIVLVPLLVYLPRWGNQLQALVQSSVLEGLGVDPSDVYTQYTQLLNV